MQHCMALAGKQIVFLPGGGKGGGLQTLNLNELLGRFAAARAVEAEVPTPDEETGKKVRISKRNGKDI